MLSCEKCNYIKNVQAYDTKEAKYICEFTGYVFYKEISEYDMHAHPCFKYKYPGNVVDSRES